MRYHEYMNDVLELTKEIERLTAALVQKDADNKHLWEMIRCLQLKLYGPRSDKAAPCDDQQAVLFVLDEDEVGEPQQDEPAPRPRSTDGKPGAGRKPLPEHLPRVERCLDLDPEEKLCCGQEMERIGEDQREVLECIPAIFYVIRYIIPKYICRVCNGQECCHGTVAMAETPTRILPKSSAGNSVIAEVVTNKMTDGLPGYRQTKRLERFGLTISRKTITNWLLSVAKRCHVLDKPLRQMALASGVIQMDETFFQVMGEEGRSNQTKSYMWVIRSPASGIIYFDYHPTRASSVPQQLLEKFKGIVQTDGYKGYDFLDKTTDVVVAACWAHVRRKFSDALKSVGRRGKKRRTNCYAEEILDSIRQLYAIEKRALDLSLADRSVLRAQEAKPILATIRQSLEEHAKAFPENSLTGKAIHYTLRLWPRLVRYADNALIPIDNNGVENAIRPFAVGRKNWLFAGCPDGARAMATLYSLIETAKANHWEPYAYLRFLFDHLPNAVTAPERLRLLPNIAQPVPTSHYVDADRNKLQELAEHQAAEPQPV